MADHTGPRSTGSPRATVATRLRVVTAVVAAVVALGRPGAARAECATDADELRAHLVEVSRSTSRWNLAWSIAFGVSAAGQFALAAAGYNPFGEFDRDYEESLYVGGAKATIGLASRVVIPLRVDVPAADPDRCVELAALRGSLTRIARKERRIFWLTHLGGTALNLSGALLLWSRRSFKVGAISFATSFPVGPLAAYTLPRKSWHRWRDQRAAWTVAILPDPTQTVLVVGRSF